ncbi:MAG TPA: SHOCT domain-containing protein [Solirubrobacterales bacterium]|nr:SHOCT domain-containing protein [Solirubrobacterales bacterium]
MFGNKKHLQEQLDETGGMVAWATVLEAKVRWTSGTNYENGPYTVGNKEHMTVKLRVEPDGEPPFEATVKQTFPGRSPKKGFKAKVIYDPAEPSKIAVLEDEIVPAWMSPEQARRSTERRRQRQEALDNGRLEEFVQEDIKAKIAAAQELAGQRTSKLLVDRAPVPLGTPAPPDVTQQLTSLADLRDRGALTEAEFEQQKARLLTSDGN